MNSDLPANVILFEMQSDIAGIEENVSIYEEKNFEERIDVIDFIGFRVIDQITELIGTATEPGELILLEYRAAKIKSGLEEIEVNLFQRLRTYIRANAYTRKQFKEMVSEYVSFDSGAQQQQEEPGYDNLDIFINSLFLIKTMPEQTRELEPEMIYYQKTPARIIFELVEKADFRDEDVFFDLGSGLGQVVILVNLLTGIRSKGIEFEPAFCAYADDCAAGLNLRAVEFMNVDARKADYSEGTVFFMFTPFKGEMLQEVLELLRRESLGRKIKLITYGPCTAQVALQRWLNCITPKSANIYKLAVFSSF